MLGLSKGIDHNTLSQRNVVDGESGSGRTVCPCRRDGPTYGLAVTSNGDGEMISYRETRNYDFDGDQRRRCIRFRLDSLSDCDGWSHHSRRNDRND